MIPVYSKIQSPNELLNRVQSNIAKTLNPIVDLPQTQVVLLTKVALNGTTLVPHGLGRVLRGWRIVRQRAAATIYDLQDTNNIPSVTLVLVSSAAVTVDLEVF